MQQLENYNYTLPQLMLSLYYSHQNTFKTSILIFGFKKDCRILHHRCFCLLGQFFFCIYILKCSVCGSHERLPAQVFLKRRKLWHTITDFRRLKIRVENRHGLWPAAVTIIIMLSAQLCRGLGKPWPAFAICSSKFLHSSRPLPPEALKLLSRVKQLTKEGLVSKEVT